MEEEAGTPHFTAKPFGDENSSKEEVYAFYKEWEGFSSIKNFAYVDVYDSREAPNRRIKRLIEVDNNRARNKERNLFNEKIRELIAHVRSKDPRWTSFQEEDRLAREQRRQEIEEEKRLKREQETEKLKQYREELAEHYRKEEEEAVLRGDIDEIFEEEFRCQTCKKSFKKEGQFNNHIQSKQHKKMAAQVQALREELELDDETENINSAAQAKIQDQLKEEKKKQEEEKKAEDSEESDPQAKNAKDKLNKRL